MKIASILNQSSMPIASPSYPHGPYRFIDWWPITWRISMSKALGAVLHGCTLSPM
jgi:acetoacetate decarboxylase